MDCVSGIRGRALRAACDRKGIPLSSPGGSPSTIREEDFRPAPAETVRAGRLEKSGELAAQSFGALRHVTDELQIPSTLVTERASFLQDALPALEHLSAATKKEMGALIGQPRTYAG